MGIAVLLILVLFCGYADEAAATPEGDPAEAEASEEAFTEAESALPAENEEPAGVPESESAADETGESPQLVSETAPLPQEDGAPPAPEAISTPAPAPMPMFDIIDGQTIYLSITEEEFVEIAEILRAGLGVNDAAIAGIMGNLLRADIELIHAIFFGRKSITRRHIHNRRLAGRKRNARLPALQQCKGSCPLCPGVRSGACQRKRIIPPRLQRLCREKRDVINIVRVIPGVLRAAAFYLRPGFYIAADEINTRRKCRPKRIRPVFLRRKLKLQHK